MSTEKRALPAGRQVVTFRTGDAAPYEVGSGVLLSTVGRRRWLDAHPIAVVAPAPKAPPLDPLADGLGSLNDGLSP